MQRFLQKQCQGTNYFRMKKFITGKSKTITASFLVGGMLAGCSKEADVKPSLMNAHESKSA